MQLNCEQEASKFKFSRGQPPKCQYQEPKFGAQCFGKTESNAEPADSVIFTRF